MLHCHILELHPLVLLHPLWIKLPAHSSCCCHLLPPCSLVPLHSPRLLDFSLKLWATRTCGPSTLQNCAWFCFSLRARFSDCNLRRVPNTGRRHQHGGTSTELNSPSREWQADAATAALVTLVSIGLTKQHCKFNYFGFFAVPFPPLLFFVFFSSVGVCHLSFL